MSAETFSQSVSALVEELGYGTTYDWPALQLAACDYLIRTGTRRPSPAMVLSLALAVSDRLDEDASGAVALNA